MLKIKIYHTCYFSALALSERVMKYTIPTVIVAAGKMLSPGIKSINPPPIMERPFLANPFATPCLPLDPVSSNIIKMKIEQRIERSMLRIISTPVKAKTISNISFKIANPKAQKKGTSFRKSTCFNTENGSAFFFWFCHFSYYPNLAAAFFDSVSQHFSLFVDGLSLVAVFLHCSSWHFLVLADSLNLLQSFLIL